MRARLRVVLPPDAEILHIGATAIPNCLTKGDLDIAIRIENSSFIPARNLLQRMFKRNVGSYQSAYFAAFETIFNNVPVGFELVIKDSPLDVFTPFRDKLLSNPNLAFKYNQLKRQCHGQSMKRYRKVKSRFIVEVLQT
jgi:GrpB-like predicted nucleotidyltransferase (UPF0157 family)